MVESGNQKIWDGPIQETPWWWPLIIQLEKRLQSIHEGSAYDPDKLPPPKELFALNRQAELDEYLSSRRELGERRLREGKPLDEWSG